MKKLNLGAGQYLKEGFINVDQFPLDGIDVVHNLTMFPYPFDDTSADEIVAYDVIEHLPSHVDGENTVLRFVTECHRILIPGGTLFIQTPRYDAEFLYIDLSHVRGFHEKSFDFLDPDTEYGKTTGFYTKAKFKVLCAILENKNLQFSMVKL
jgi:predicted SAM-dependent methyltransferase